MTTPEDGSGRIPMMLVNEMKLPSLFLVLTVSAAVVGWLIDLPPSIPLAS